MGKKIVQLMMVLGLLFVCAFSLSACEDNKKANSFKVFVEGEEYSVFNDTLNFEYGTIFDISNFVSVMADFGDETKNIEIGTEFNQYTCTFDRAIKNIPDVGTYVATINYQDFEEIKININVNKRKVSPVLYMYSYNYGDVVRQPAVVGADPDATVSYYFSSVKSYSDCQEWEDVVDSTYLKCGKYYMFAHIEETDTCADAFTTFVPFYVEKGMVDVPHVESQSFYTGSEQSVQITQSPLWEFVSGNTGTAVGDYSAVIKLKDANNYAWAPNGDTVANVEIGWSIQKATPTLTDVVTAEAGDLLEDIPLPKVSYGTWSWCDDGSNANTIVLSGYFATYYVKFQPNAENVDNYNSIDKIGIKVNLFEQNSREAKQFVDFGAEVKDANGIANFNWTGDIVTINELCLENFDEDIFALEGDVFATECGTYTLKVVLKDNSRYKWEDNSVTPIYLTWKIIESVS